MKTKTKTFRVFATELSRYYLDVKAKTKGEAYIKAKDSDDGEFVPVGDNYEENCDWVLDADDIRQIN